MLPMRLFGASLRNIAIMGNRKAVPMFFTLNLFLVTGCVPRGAKRFLLILNIPKRNIQLWRRSLAPIPTTSESVPHLLKGSDLTVLILIWDVPINQWKSSVQVRRSLKLPSLRASSFAPHKKAEED